MQYKEIGGYIELDKYYGNMLHQGEISLNCGRNCLAYLIKTKNIKKIAIPYFLCDSVTNLCQKENIKIRYYNIDKSFKPVNVELQEDEWLYLVNYYGQIDKDYIKKCKEKYKNIIVDNAQAYFEEPIENADTLYTCRKFFGVSDGAFLYTDKILDEELEVDESFKRMNFLIGRFERTASEFYNEYSENNKLFSDEPIKKMSKLTDNLLHGIDYDFVNSKRTENYKFLFDRLSSVNNLNLNLIEGAFAYPLLIENGAEIRKKLQKLKIYIPTLWPNVLNDVDEYSLEYNYAKNILPLPCDQRYDENDMEYLIKEIFRCIC